MLGYTGRWDTSEHASDEIVRFEPPKPNPCRYFGAISYVHELMKVSDMDKIMRSGCSSRWVGRSARAHQHGPAGRAGRAGRAQVSHMAERAGRDAAQKQTGLLCDSGRVG